jgi:hypothetical protein
VGKSKNRNQIRTRTKDKLAIRLAKEQTRTEKAIEDFIVIPFLIMLGLYITGAVVDSMLHTTYTFEILFAGVGGIPMLIYYFKKKISDYT